MAAPDSTTEAELIFALNLPKIVLHYHTVKRGMLNGRLRRTKRLLRAACWYDSRFATGGHANPRDPARLPVALVHLCPPLHRHHYQLHRPPGVGPAEAADLARAGLDRSGFRVDRIRVSNRVRDRHATGGPADRLGWAEARLRDRDRSVERGGDEPLAGAQRISIRDGALRARYRRIRE